MKTYSIVKNRKGKESTISGTLSELIDYFGYTLETGKSYEHEKGNKKINMSPKTIGSLVNNLNNAVNNSAANGYSDTSYSLTDTDTKLV